MLDLLGESGAVFVLGLCGGLALGLAARMARFCTLGMIEDAHFGQDLTRAWMWLAALGAATFVNFAADAAGFVDLGAVALLGSHFSVAGAVIGGLLFGYGMALAGNCGFGMLARLGGGDLRALVIAMVMGVTAYATIHGVLAPLRIVLFPSVEAPDPTGFAHAVSSMTALSPGSIGMGVGIVLVTISASRLLGAGRRNAMMWSLIAGIAVASGFIGTYRIAVAGFEVWDVGSHSFTQPMGSAIQYLMFSSALRPDFALGSVLGVVLGGTIGSILRGELRWEACEDHRELRRQMGGAVLMGIGAVLAAGCSLGQGLSALSVLSFTAPLVALSIWIGAWVGLRRLILGTHGLT